MTSWLSVSMTAGPVQANGTPDPDRVTPGLAGFLVVFVLALATLVLIRSMTKHLRKVRYSPDPTARREDGERVVVGPPTSEPMVAEPVPLDLPPTEEVVSEPVASELAPAELGEADRDRDPARWTSEGPRPPTG